MLRYCLYFEERLRLGETGCTIVADFSDRSC